MYKLHPYTKSYVYDSVEKPSFEEMVSPFMLTHSMMKEMVQDGAITMETTTEELKKENEELEQLKEKYEEKISRKRRLMKNTMEIFEE